MSRLTLTWLAAALLAIASASGTAPAQESKWRAEHDAGWQAYKDGQFTEAERRLRAAEGIAQAFGANDPRLATTLDHLAWVLCAQEKAAAAEPLAKQALAIREKTLGGEHPDVVKSLNTLACLYDMEGKAAEAKALHERQLALAEKLQGKEHANVAAILDNLATVNHVLGKHEEAEAAYKRALAIREKTSAEKPMELAPTLYNLGTLYLDEGKYAEAEPLLKRALAHPREIARRQPSGRGDEPRGARLAPREARQACRGRAAAQACPFDLRGNTRRGPSSRGTLLREDGPCLLRQGKDAEAESCCKQAISIFEKAPQGPTPPTSPRPWTSTRRCSGTPTGSPKPRRPRRVPRRSGRAP